MHSALSVNLRNKLHVEDYISDFVFEELIAFGQLAWRLELVNQGSLSKHLFLACQCWHVPLVAQSHWHVFKHIYFCNFP